MRERSSSCVSTATSCLKPPAHTNTVVDVTINKVTAIIMCTVPFLFNDFCNLKLGCALDVQGQYAALQEPDVCPLATVAKTATAEMKI